MALIRIEEHVVRVDVEIRYLMVEVRFHANLLSLCWIVNARMYTYIRTYIRTYIPFSRTSLMRRRSMARIAWVRKWVWVNDNSQIYHIRPYWRHCIAACRWCRLCCEGSEQTSQHCAIQSIYGMVKKHNIMVAWPSKQCIAQWWSM